jgi:hypothetical protein
VRQLGSLPKPQGVGGIASIPSVIVRDSDFVVGDAASYELRWYTFNGRLRRLVRLNARVEPLTIDDKRSIAEMMVPRGTSAGIRKERVSRIVREFTLRTLPAFGDVHVDPEGRIWVADYASNTDWTVFEKSGMLLGRVRIPAAAPNSRLRLLRVYRDFLILREDDDDGAPVIRFHRLLAVSHAR